MFGLITLSFYDAINIGSRIVMYLWHVSLVTNELSFKQIKIANKTSPFCITN